DVVDAIRPILSAHFKPALLGRMTIVPFRPVTGPILRDITILKLGRLAARLAESHGLATEYAPALIDELTRRCTDADSGARTVDHVLRSSLMPSLARELLERIADDDLPGRLRVDLGPEGDWRFDFDDP
ncbi:MAG: type VI secretion system ATPase TssH, partial [Myxococcales bacterium]|nr:type VI secretion system ATPase TssH [Myxococcales bacterium]